MAQPEPPPPGAWDATLDAIARGTSPRAKRAQHLLHDARSIAATEGVESVYFAQYLAERLPEIDHPCPDVPMAAYARR